MIALEVSRNGRRLCLAGVGENGVVSSSLHWCGYGAGKKRLRPQLEVGGLDSIRDEFVTWIKRALVAGDEITIRVVEAKAVDKPKKRMSAAPIRRFADRASRAAATRGQR